MNEQILYGPPPISPSYQGDCSGTSDPNPYFPRPTAAWRSQPPFWYAKGPCSLQPLLSWPVGLIDDYKFETLPQPLSGKTLLEEMEVERPERYLPGEIYRNEPVKRPIEDLSKTANCPKIWAPKDPLFYCEFQPTNEIMNPPLLLDGVLQRKAQTLNSYNLPKNVTFSDTCECVEDTEMKNTKKPNYLEALKYADTRCDDFECTPDTKIYFEDSCKVPDDSVKVPPGVWRKVWRPSAPDEKYTKPGTLQESVKNCECGCDKKSK